MNIDLILPYPPAGTTGNHAVQHGGGGHYLTPAAKRYRTDIAVAVVQQGGNKHLTGPLAVVWIVNPPDLRARDCDNLRKTCADNLTKAGVWLDDSNKVIKRELFVWGEVVKNGRVTVKIRAHSDEETLL